MIAVGPTNMSEIHDFEGMIHDSNGKEVTAHDTYQDGRSDGLRSYQERSRMLALSPLELTRSVSMDTSGFLLSPKVRVDFKMI